MTPDSIPPDQDRRTLPDRRKAEFNALDQKIDERFDILSDRIGRWIKKSGISLIIIGIACAIAILAFGIVLRREGNNAAEIQHQRRDSIARTCKDQNKRHDDTVIEFNRLADRAAVRNPKMAEQIHDNVKANLRIIDAIAPKQDCVHLVTLALAGDQR